jgi:hypothetical protein
MKPPNYTAPPLTISSGLAQFDVQTSGLRYATVSTGDADRSRSEI